MKILYFVTQGEQGGAQKYVLDLAVSMRRKGHDIYVATGIQREAKDGWLFESLGERGFSKEKLFELKNHVREVSIVKDLKGLKDFICLVKNVQPDVVHLNSSKAGFVGALASTLCRVKTVYTVHGFVFLEPLNFLVRSFYFFLELLSSCLRNFTILVSGKDVEVGKRLFILRGKAYKLVYNGLTEKNKLEMLVRGDARKYIFEKVGKSFSQDVRIVGTISNLYRTKGLEFLIESAKKVVQNLGGESIIFVVLGFGPESYKKELERKVRENGLEKSFFFLGKTTDAFKYLKAFDLFTLTSVKEGLPYTLIEAKMAGVPILSSRVGGIPEMAKSFPINLIEAKNTKQIADKILEILNDTEKYKTDDNLPEVYKLETMVNETERIYIQEKN
jgi:glycosyltransferase involved in cell wall biosynthesis